MTLKIALVQMNAHVGNIAANIQKIKSNYSAAVANGADIVVTGECSVTGYPLEDLVQNKTFIAETRAAINDLAKHIKETGKAGLVIGAPLSGLDPTNLFDVFNCAIFIDPSDTENLLSVSAKYELPNYGVFDEKRVFSSNIDFVKTFTFRGVDFATPICEDIWKKNVFYHYTQLDNPPEFIISINGSPFTTTKHYERIKVVKDRKMQLDVPFAYVNLVGGQDELVFDGHSFISRPLNQIVAKGFEEDILYWTPTDQSLSTSGQRTYSGSTNQKIYQSLVLGTRDYMAKQGFTDAVIGYSGGVDSGIVAAIAVDALGPEHVTLVSLPSKFSSDHSKSDAAAGAERLKTEFRTINIEPVVESLRVAYSSSINHTTGLNAGDLTGVADENIQARARGTILMAISNQEGKILLTTGNKSEVSVGYSTLYGDMAGGFNPIKDVYKTTVWELCKWRNSLTQNHIDQFGFLGSVGDVVPEEIINKPPSAELREGQKDSDSLPKYEILDNILVNMVDKNLSDFEVINATGASSHQVSRIRKLVKNAEYKRRQSAPGVKITDQLFGRDRRYPIVNDWA